MANTAPAPATPPAAMTSAVTRCSGTRIGGRRTAATASTTACRRALDRQRDRERRRRPRDLDRLHLQDAEQVRLRAGPRIGGLEYVLSGSLDLRLLDRPLAL